MGELDEKQEVSEEILEDGNHAEVRFIRRMCASARGGGESAVVTPEVTGSQKQKGSPAGLVERLPHVPFSIRRFLPDFPELG